MRDGLGDISAEMSSVSWIFILCFPNGGSTALAQVLLTAKATAALSPRAEGQWLIPEMCAQKRRWDPAHFLDYDRIREIWRSKALKDRSADQPRITIIEKSPPIMVRYKALVEAFGSDETGRAHL